MKKHSPKNISLEIALYVLLIFFVLFLTYYLIFQGHQWDWIIILLSGAVFFGVVYLIVRHSIENFIYKKIRVLYKTIHNLKAPKQKARIEERWMENAEAEMEKWVEDKKNELESLKKSENYRRDFLGNVSHELKTPIFNIQGYILTLIDGGLEDQSINREYLLRAEKSIDRMIAIVNDLDVIAKLESETMKMEMEKFELSQLVQDVYEAYEIKGKEKNISFLAHNKLSGLVHVSADKEKIRQVLNNLIENAIKYGKQNGRVKVTFYDWDEMVLVEVSDNGIGISQDDIPRIFERFYRTSHGKNVENRGSGLGLSIVKHIIEAHGQTINVRSSLGVGTTFGFTLQKA
ncbi:MAG TPA: ATP-binding protein [Bacteroidales bacterium]|nr:ATP-binding protein [Bacteroidales bacterium]HPS26809.1 ATP-binding protein [Bacteroidales bacterium]